MLSSTHIYTYKAVHISVLLDVATFVLLFIFQLLALDLLGNYFLCSKTMLARWVHTFSFTVCLNRQERTQTQQLRDEQDEAYYESVRADQEKVSVLACNL